MDLNFPVFATGVCIFRASNPDVGPLFVGPGSTRILEKKTQGKQWRSLGLFSSEAIR